MLKLTEEVPKIRILADKTISPFLKIDKNESKRKLNALTYENKQKNRARYGKTGSKSRLKWSNMVIYRRYFRKIINGWSK